MSKYVQLNLFNLDGSAASVFKIFPQEAHTGSLRDWIELAGGILLEPDEEDPYTITLIDVEWFSETAGSDEINIPSDCFLSSFIYECYEWERVFDLNKYRYGESKYVPYDANEILRRITSWSDLKLLPVREALPLVLESPEFLYETPQKRYRLEEDQSTETSIISSSQANESSEPIGSQDGILEPGEADGSEMDPSLNLTPVVSVSIGHDEELVLRRIQSEDENTSDIEEVPVPTSTEKKRRKASDESSPNAKRKKQSQSSKSKKSSEATHKKFQNNKSRKRKISSTNAESIVHDVEDNSTEIRHPELNHGEEIEVFAPTPAKSPIKKAERGVKHNSPQKMQKHVNTTARKEITEEREVKENGTEPPLKRTKDKTKRRKKEGEERQQIPEPAQLDADVDLSEINTDAHSPDQKPSETSESVQEMNSTNGLPQTKKRKRKKVTSSSSISTPSIPTDASTIELPSPDSSKTTEESSDNSDIEIIPYKDRIRSGTAVPCTLCSFRCLNQFELVNHMRLHTGERKFSCPYCSFFTNDKSILTKHKEDHKVGKKLQCLKCVFSTGSRSQLEAHCKTHDEVKTYHCNLCDFKSTTAYDLRKHGLTHQQNGKT